MAFLCGTDDNFFQQLPLHPKPDPERRVRDVIPCRAHSDWLQTETGVGLWGIKVKQQDKVRLLTHIKNYRQIKIRSAQRNLSAAPLLSDCTVSTSKHVNRLRSQGACCCYIVEGLANCSASPCLCVCVYLLLQCFIPSGVWYESGGNPYVKARGWWLTVGWGEGCVRVFVFGVDVGACQCFSDINTTV